MVASSIFAGFRTASVGLAAFSVFLGITPAQANSAAATDISAPLRAAQAASVSGDDEQFHTLFSTWQNFEQTGLAAVKPRAAVGSAGIGSVSIPSRSPLEAMTMTSSFGMREHPILGGVRQHKGVDLAAPIGTPVHATADGVVGKASWFGGYGLYVQLEHGGNLETRYGHMSRLNVAEGQVVHKGDVIGYVGTTGNSTGPHLHYEVRVSGEAVNPVSYMQGGTIAASDSDTAKGG